MFSNVHLVGASIRAAAFSAIRSGLTPRGWDLFADADLVRVAHVEQLRELTDPAPLAHGERSWAPLMYTGGMENQLAWLLEAEASGPVWATSAESARLVRDPVTVARQVQALNLPAPEVLPGGSPPPRDGRWVVKPLASAGGRGIALWDGAVGEDFATLREPHVFQQFISGTPYSAVFIGFAPPSDVQYVGLTRQLIGLPELGSRNFQWCGTLGPAALPMTTEHLIRRIGNVLRWKFGLLGLFGCDFVVDPEGTPWLIEINPRYPASLEVLEISCGFSAIRSHAAAFGASWEAADPPFARRPEGVIAKGVLSARSEIEFPAVDPEGLATPFELVGRVADVPRPGTKIPLGSPVCTVFVQGESDVDALLALGRAAKAIEKRIAAAAAGGTSAPISLAFDG